MKDFDELRRLAREKRDSAIKDARNEYRVTLEEINALQSRLLAKPSQKGKPRPSVSMRQKILRVVPTDREWSVNELLTWLKSPKTDKNHVRAYLGKMQQSGSIKQIRRGKRNVEALFAVTDFEAASSELNAMTQVQAARRVMEDIGDNVDVVVLAVEMCERGYRPAAKNNREFVKSLRTALRRRQPENTSSDALEDDRK